MTLNFPVKGDSNSINQVPSENPKSSFLVKNPKTVTAIGVISAGVFGTLVMGGTALLTISAFPFTIAVASGVVAAGTALLIVALANKILLKKQPEKAGLVEIYHFDKQGDLAAISFDPNYSVGMKIARSIFRFSRGTYRTVKNTSNVLKEQMSRLKEAFAKKFQKTDDFPSPRRYRGYLSRL